MKNIKLTLIFLLLVVITSSCAQTKKGFQWPNEAQSALSLTYDDGLPSHINTVAPILKKYNFKATFYITMSSPSLYEEMSKWKSLAIEGHELGNHTNYHPCQKSVEGMEWVPDYYDLDKYTAQQIADEIKVANTLLLAMDEEKTRTFAYPCAHTFAGGKSYKEIVDTQFIAARGSSGEQEPLHKPTEIDLLNVQSWSPNNHNADELITYIKNSLEQETFTTITFHGIGAEHLRVSAEDHEKMLQFLDANRDKIWVATFKEVTAYLKSKRNNTGK